MSYFGVKRKTVVFTAIQRMVDDDSIIPSSKVALAKYLAVSKESPTLNVMGKGLADYLIEGTQAAISSRYDRAFRFADAGRFAYGIPTASSISKDAVDLKAELETYLEGSLGHSIDMVYATIGDPNYHHFMWQKLIDSYGYDATTNELLTLSISTGFACYLSKAELFLGTETLAADVTGETRIQYGFSSESGECLTRNQDLNAPPTTVVNDLLVDDAYVVVTYKYIEIVPDVTTPINAVINNLSTTTLDGYAEKDSNIGVYVNTVLLTTITADNTGFFTHTFSPSVVATDTIKTVVIDTALNASTGLDTVVPYTNGSPATTGPDKTITEVIHTETFTFDFLDTIGSDVQIIPSEADTPPTVVIGSDAYVPQYDYIQACYTYVASSITHIVYFTYAYGSGSIITLDDMYLGTSTAGEFYPRLYIRLNGASLPDTLNKTSAEYKSSKQLAKILGLDWKEVSDNIQSGIADIGDVGQLFITSAVPMNTTDPVLIEYLYRYWLKTWDDLTTDITTGSLAGMNAKHGIGLSVKDNVYNHYISFKGISANTVVGSIGAEGTYTSLHGAIAETVTGGFFSFIISIPYHAYRYQNSPTTYVEVRVFGASSTHSFSGLSTSASGTDGNLIIPLDRTATTHMTTSEKELLFNKCFYVFVNMTKVIKTKFHERGAFRILLTIVVIVITILTAGAGAPLAILLQVATNLVIGALISIVITELIKAGIITGSFATAVAVVALIASAYSGYTNTNLLNLTATQLLQGASFAFDAAGKAYTFDLKQVMKESEAFSGEMQNKLDELKDAKLLLGKPVMPLDLELLISNSRSSIFINLGESPEEFMAKNPVNIISIIAASVEDFVSIKLQSPSLKQMLNQTSRDTDDGLSLT